MLARFAFVQSLAALLLPGITLPGSSTAQVVSTFGAVSSPWSPTFDAAGNVYVSGRAASFGFVVRFPAGGGTGVVFASGLSAPTGLAFSASGDLYVGDRGQTGGFGPGRIWKVTPAGVRTVFADPPGLNDPAFLEFDGGGNLLISDRVQRRMWSVSPAGVLGEYGPILGATGEWAGQFVIEPSGDVVIGVGPYLKRIGPGGSPVTIVASDLGSVQGVAPAPGGGYLIGRNGTSDLWLVSGGVAVPWAGSTAGCVDGLMAEAKFGAPQGLEVRDSRLFVADLNCNAIRVIETPTPARTTSWGRVKSTYR